MTTVYVDGACKNNHLRAERRAAGAGVYIDVESDAEPVTLGATSYGSPRASMPDAQSKLPRFVWRPLRAVAQLALTNNRAELLAVIVALEILIEHEARLARPIVVTNDSQLVYYTVTRWLPGWRRRQYKKANGEPVSNIDLVRRLDALLGRAAPLHIEWRHMNSHCAEPRDKSSAEWRAWHGNEIADRLANWACAEQRRELAAPPALPAVPLRAKRKQKRARKPKSAASAAYARAAVAAHRRKKVGLHNAQQ